MGDQEVRGEVGATASKVSAQLGAKLATQIIGEAVK